MWSLLKKVKIELPGHPDLSCSFLVVQLEESKLKYLGNTCTSAFTDALSRVAKVQNQTRCPLTDERIKKTRHS